MTDVVSRPELLVSHVPEALNDDCLRSLRASFLEQPAFRVAQNAVAQNSLDDVALNRGVIASIDHTFSTLLDDWSVTDQKQTGRCWMFAGLNLLRWSARQKMDLKELEF